MNRPPILMHRDEVITLKRAAAYAGRSTDTIRKWNRQHMLARQAGDNAPLEISVIALEMVLHGDFAALELLRAGERDHPAVQKYITHLGLPG